MQNTTSISLHSPFLHITVSECTPFLIFYPNTAHVIMKIVFGGASELSEKAFIIIFQMIQYKTPMMTHQNASWKIYYAKKM